MNIQRKANDSFLTKDCFLVDRPMRIVCGTPYHLIVTLADVVHSFSVPSLNLKMDAIPGRLSHLFFVLLRMEPLLGIVPNYTALEHRIMPIMIEVKDVGKQVSFVLVQYVVVAFRDKDLLWFTKQNSGIKSINYSLFIRFVFVLYSESLCLLLCIIGCKSSSS